MKDTHGRHFGMDGEMICRQCSYRTVAMTAYGRAVNKLTMRLLVNEMPMCFDGGNGAACICVSLCSVVF